MALSPMVTAMIQSAALGAFSNVLAQVLTATKAGTSISIDWIPVFQFLLFNLIAVPPNFLWQDFLESTFPAHPKPAPHPKKSDTPAPPPALSIRNTIIKIVLDQTIGAALNTLLFSTFTHSLRLALRPSPPITSLPKAAAFWTSPGAVDFRRVDWSRVWDASCADFRPIYTAGLQLWPAVSVINFTLVKTVEGRNLVGALAGVVWGVYMSMFSAE